MRFPQWIRSLMLRMLNSLPWHHILMAHKSSNSCISTFIVSAFCIKTFGRDTSLLQHLLSETLFCQSLAIVAPHSWIHLWRHKDLSFRLVAMVCFHNAHHVVILSKSTPSVHRLHSSRILAELGCINHAYICVAKIVTIFTTDMRDYIWEHDTWHAMSCSWSLLIVLRVHFWHINSKTIG